MHSFFILCVSQVFGILMSFYVFNSSLNNPEELFAGKLYFVRSLGRLFPEILVANENELCQELAANAEFIFANTQMNDHEKVSAINAYMKSGKY